MKADQGFLSEEKIRFSFTGIATSTGCEYTGHTMASVLIPIFFSDEWRVLYTRRTDHVKSHKGQVAFPGGARESSDTSPADTALREAWEEIGLPPHMVEVIGNLQDFTTFTNYCITPVVSLIKWPFPVSLQKAEVERVFSIPLNWLANPQNRYKKDVTMPNGNTYTVIYYHPYDGETLWGISASITVSLLSALKI